MEEPSPRPSPVGPPRGRGRGAVELDDSSHQRAKVKERDGFVDGALEAAGVRVVRVKWGRGYDLEKVAGVLWAEVGAAAV